MATTGNKIKQKISTKYYCEFCNYETIRKSNFETHILSNKHSLATLGNKIKQNLSNVFICDKCNKIYKDRTGLWKHKTKGHCDKNDCIIYQPEDENIECKHVVEPIDKDLILLLIKENTDFKNMMIEQQCKMMEHQSKMMEQQNIVLEIAKNGTHNTTTTTTNSHNKSFNLQFFLNETCKDAMNITDFVDSLKLQLSDLERVGELGYIEGISSIIVKNLKEMDVTQRPVHCTDKKRETIYIKDEDKWEKDEEKKKMHKLVRKVADKNARLLPKFKEKYPDYNKSASIVSDQFNKIIIESMGGHGDNDYEKEEKIIKKVSKEIAIDK
jgi:hypothetical protein